MKGTHMRKIILIGSILGAALALTACTDTTKAHWSALGDVARVTCFSGGKVIADDYSTGKVANADGSDGYEFKSQTTGRLTQFSGDCVVDYGAKQAAGWKAVLP